MTTHYIGRCKAKGCKTTVRLSAPETKVTGRSNYGWDITKPALTLPSLRAQRDPSGGWLDPHHHGWIVEDEIVTFVQAAYMGRLSMCVQHRRILSWSPVVGHRSESVRCDARCENARGVDCECSCVGENHGKAWAA